MQVHILLFAYGGVVDDVEVYTNGSEACDRYRQWWHDWHGFQTKLEIEDYRRMVDKDSCLMFTAEVE